MSKTARVPEPSMEEILASIRRIIADDNNAPAQAGAAAAPAAEAAAAPAAKQDAPADQPEAEVLDLTQPVEPRAPEFKTIDGADVTFREEPRPSAPAPTPPAAPAKAPAAQAPAPSRGAAMKDQDLLSPTSAAAVSAAFNSLATTVLAENARTLEDLVKEMMRPMLKQWLEENLPGLVERMVRNEIERVARGR